MKNIFIYLGLILVLVVGIFAYKAFLSKEKVVVPTENSLPVEEVEIVSDYKNATYKINGQSVTLADGVAAVEAAPGSASNITTQYFGNALVTDLNADGIDDVAFILTQDTGGSGVFYYAVGAVMTDDGYVGTDGYLLGDRIAPQSTDISPNPRHKNVVVFNYLDRALDESMTTQPSVGKSAYLKLVPEDMMWATVEPDFEGESR